jgi:hypothetical protein
MRVTRFSCFQNTINFDFSPKIDQDMTKHKKKGVGSGLIYYETIEGKLLKIQRIILSIVITMIIYDQAAHSTNFREQLLYQLVVNRGLIEW